MILSLLLRGMHTGLLELFSGELLPAIGSRLPSFFIRGSMITVRYVDDVLQPTSLPYQDNRSHAFFQQNNARFSIACPTADFLQEASFQVMVTHFTRFNNPQNPFFSNSPNFLLMTPH